MALSPWQLCFHTDLKCRARGCNNRRVVIADVASLPFCRQHACSAVFRGKSCLRRGHGEQRLCSHHSSIHNNPKKCTCSPPPPHCPKYTCGIKDCDHPRRGPGSCCPKHTCQAEGCVNCVDGHNAKTSSKGKQPEGRCHHCRGHHHHPVCQADGCESLVFLDVANRAGKYCYRHFCPVPVPPSNPLTTTPTPESNTDGGGCSGQRVDGAGASACRDHTCALYPLCVKPRADAARGLFCADHECKDRACRRQRYDGGSACPLGDARGAPAIILPGAGRGPWCVDHMCVAALSRREDCGSRREGTPQNPLFCADHEPCGEAGCDAFRAFKGRERQDRCEEHLKSKCAFPSCPLDATADARGNALPACRYHACRHVGCMAVLSSESPSSLYCDAHRCRESACPNPRAAAAAAAEAEAGEITAGFCVEHQRVRAFRGPGVRGRGGGGVNFFCGMRHNRRHRRCLDDSEEDSDSDEFDNDGAKIVGGDSCDGCWTDVGSYFCKKCHKSVKHS
ncbi:hypothetical protein AAE478_005708 [Parahypoxylon ruwenzoriense]